MKIPVPYVPENLSPEQNRLLEAVAKAHQQAATTNKNVSSVTFMNVMMGSGRIENAMAAAILSIGSMHAPILEARGLYRMGQKEVVKMQLMRGHKIAGFGNSFFKTNIDPAWSDVWSIIRISFPKAAERIDELTGWMIELGKPLYPNAALFTAAACDICGIRGGTESSLFMLWRLPVLVDEMTKGWEEQTPDPNKLLKA